MTKPDFDEIIRTLEGHSQNLKENAQIGNSKLILAFAAMIKVMGWSSHQADTNNIQIANLTDEIKDLKAKLITYNGRLECLTWILVVLTVILVIVGILPLLK